MSVEHTPGPWFVSGPFIGPRLAADSGIQIKVARVAGDETDVECIANARLIAAAPDMLTALKEARAALHKHYVDWDGEPEDAVPLQLARAKCDAAIARATQETPHAG